MIRRFFFLLNLDLVLVLASVIGRSVSVTLEYVLGAGADSTSTRFPMRQVVRVEKLEYASQLILSLFH